GRSRGIATAVGQRIAIVPIGPGRCAVVEFLAATDIPAHFTDTARSTTTGADVGPSVRGVDEFPAAQPHEYMTAAVRENQVAREPITRLVPHLMAAFELHPCRPADVLVRAMQIRLMRQTGAVEGVRPVRA